MNRQQLSSAIDQRIDRYEANFGLLPGIIEHSNRFCFIQQIVDSIHRVEFVSKRKQLEIDPRRADPNEPDWFDPLLAAMHHQLNGNFEEACWLIFIFTHFGKHKRGGWRYAREVYGNLGMGDIWDWNTISQNIDLFKAWIDDNHIHLTREGAGFGNHRKYESMSKTGDVVESYIDWLGPSLSHFELFEAARIETNGHSGSMFHYLYRSMSRVKQFGRTGKFDYLTMIGKMELASIAPPLAYVTNATGPKEGAFLLFGRKPIPNPDLENLFIQLANHLQIGLQELEDAICNWQKSPDRFIHFSG